MKLLLEKCWADRRKKATTAKNSDERKHKDVSQEVCYLYVLKSWCKFDKSIPQLLDDHFFDQYFTKTSSRHKIFSSTKEALLYIQTTHRIGDHLTSDKTAYLLEVCGTKRHIDQILSEANSLDSILKRVVDIRKFYDESAGLSVEQLEFDNPHFKQRPPLSY